jgi:hypothetical protein
MSFLKKKKRKKIGLIRFFQKRSRVNYWWKVAHWSSWLFVANTALICFSFFVILSAFNLQFILSGPVFELFSFIFTLIVIFSASVIVWYKFGSILAGVVKKDQAIFILTVSFWANIPLFVMLTSALVILGLVGLSFDVGFFTLAFLFAISLVSFLALVIQYFIAMIGALTE